MDYQATQITLSLVDSFLRVNAYLLKTSQGFILIDTGTPLNRRKLERELAQHGVQPGALKLVLLTHGDIDHTGNAIYLRRNYGAPIGMHPGDAGVLENGDMFWNRKFEGKWTKRMIQKLMPVRPANMGKPDILLSDGDSLAAYGLDGAVLNTPGHSTGSLCVLTSVGDLFCGDLFTNRSGKPRLNSMLYDHPAGQASFERLKALPIKTVYPGHGAPFAWKILISR